MSEFWVASGHLLLDRTSDGHLVLTDDYLRAYLARPELMPSPEACAAERDLHARLMAKPCALLPSHCLAALADPDARDNWRRFLALRNALVGASTLEAAYIRLASSDLSEVPPLFLDQLVHVILRAALDATPDPFILRAAELFFRPQRVATHEGRVLLADAETIEKHEANHRAYPLLDMLRGPAITELESLTEENALTYYGRSDAHDLVLDLDTGRQALADVIRAWLRHLLTLDAMVEPVLHIDDPDWRWFVGLDAEATRIGNALWRGEDSQSAANLLALFRLYLPREAVVLDRVRDHPCYLLMAVDRHGTLRTKPHNLLTGLPVQYPR